MRPSPAPPTPSGGRRYGPTANNNNVSSSSSSSTSSSGYSSDDDENIFTGGGGGGGGGEAGTSTEAEREAMIRRKLLESFYGTEAAAAAVEAEMKESSSGDAKKQQQQSEVEEDSEVEEAEAEAAGEVLQRHALNSTITPRRPSLTKQPRSQQGQQTTPQPQQRHPSAKTSSTNKTSTNLDSPNFNPTLYTRNLLLTSYTETLLGENEKLATDIRGLDSTMQTLVYENYTKFIDATDAIRSIGRSVDASETGLRKLAQSMEHIERTTKSVDEALGSSREAVAEKLRVKRLLRRLDALLKLPQTLRDQIAAGKYRGAARSHAAAAHVLARHSEGFESLGRIEMECVDIMERMYDDLKWRLKCWSGDSSRHDGRRGGINNKRGRVAAMAEQPKSVREIFEVAGTLVLLAPEYDRHRHCGGESGVGGSKKPDEGDDAQPEEVTGGGSDDEGLLDDRKIVDDIDDDDGSSSRSYKSLSLVACSRLLERILETHRENSISSAASSPSGSPSRTTARNIFSQELIASTSATEVEQQQSVVPRTFFDGLLEAATLFGVTFAEDENDDEEHQRLLSDFVTDLFGSFLTYARLSLLERGSSTRADATGDSKATKGDQVDNDAGGLLSSDDEDEEHALLKQMEEEYKLPSSPFAQDLSERNSKHSFDTISTDLTRLIRSVRELASGLSLPEVGLDMRVSSTLVERTVEMVESIVRRQVYDHFANLRRVTVSRCIAPFATSLVQQPSGQPGEEEEAPPTTMAAKASDIEQLAYVMVGDVMQTTDDAVADVAEMLRTAPVEGGMVRQSVRRNARGFALWLAGSLEVLAGCDAPSSAGIKGKKKGGGLMLDVTDVASGEEDGSHAVDGSDVLSSPSPSPQRGLSKGMKMDFEEDSMSDLSVAAAADEDDEDEDKDDEDPVYALLADLWWDNDTDDSEACDRNSNLTLAIAEACRLAERRVSESIDRSVADVLSNGNNANVRSGETVDTTSHVISKRFRSAATRVLTLYATNRGARASEASREAFQPQSVQANVLAVAPREVICRILEVAKATSLDCADVFGGDRRSAPAPTFQEDDMTVPPPPPAYATTHRGVSLASTVASGIRGLQLDVERMFTEKAPIYHSVEFTRESVVAAVLRIAFKAMVEYSRLYVFTLYGYQQLQIDVELLRHMIPHYVDPDMAGTLHHLLDDVMFSASERAVEGEQLDEDLVLTYIRRFMDENVCSTFFISDVDGE